MQAGEILELALRYLRIIFAGSLFVNFAQSSNMIMRGEGLLKQAMLFSAGSAIMNIILDPIFILLLKPMAWELMELHMQQWLRRLRMQWLLFGILSEGVRL